VHHKICLFYFFTCIEKQNKSLFKKRIHKKRKKNKTNLWNSQIRILPYNIDLILINIACWIVTLNQLFSSRSIIWLGFNVVSNLSAMNHQSPTTKIAASFRKNSSWKCFPTFLWKILLRFKCVSQSWKELISTPSFVKLHLKRSAVRSRSIIASRPCI